ncbi:WD40 repeat domain-containing protein [Gemmata sp. JC673]|uniref:WD40 repeat domain-containing protein n=1 Tax=Gemmata algarum TaxID=2975278 RepID=A0ABU5F0S7_9BACT|nr:WD40 repeat domain-containing protein [Gemmata algarum]MDY3559526.1 WD40 repeat domain-containing protein [Gemmata algarum]
MRVIETGLGAVRATAVSPDGRRLAVSGEHGLALFEWATGERVSGVPGTASTGQVVFGPTGTWVAHVASAQLLHLYGDDSSPALLGDGSEKFAGGVAISPDGRLLAATTDGRPNRARLVLWSLPTLKPAPGFEFWPPLHRLAFSPNGQFLAGVWRQGFELRFAVSGGIDYSYPSTRPLRSGGAPNFVSFDRASRTCTFGWDDQFHVIDIATGTSKRGPTVRDTFRDAAFSPGADLFATVGDNGRLKFWSPATWTVVREYDWNCGPLTCLAFTADGSAGVCGTADGRLVQFDVDQ